MSLFTDASLVMIPSGIKDQKVYSVTPTDGSGDLTFSRASNATRVNSSGLVEKVRENAFYKSTALITSSRFATYNSTPVSTGTYPVYSDSLAYSFPVNGPSEGFQIIVPSGSAVRSLSIYLKDFNTVNLYYTGTAPLNTISDAGTINGYNRYVVVFDGGANNFYFRPNNNNGTPTTVYATAPQIEDGDYPTAYISNDTTASVVSVGPVSGLPRLDYSGGASCPSLLLEPQRTNLVTYSEQIDDSSWNKNACTISANASTSPDGYLGADKFIPNNAASGANFQKVNFGASGSTAYSYSVFLKAAGFTSVEVGLIGRSPAYNGGAFAQVNLTTGAITSTYLDGTWTSATSKIDALNDGWYRVSVSGVSPSGTTGLTPAVISLTTGNGTDGFFVWGAQVEAGAYATSYIPTLSSAVTRVADSASKTGISSLIGQTEGTMFVEIEEITKETGGYYLEISDNSNANRILVQNGSGANRINIYAQSAAGTQVNTSPTDTFVGRVKIAIAYANNDFKVYANGSEVVSETSFDVPTCSKLSVGVRYNNTSQLGGNVNQALLFKTRLSNSDLATLTA